MAIKTYNPVTPTLRFKTTITFDRVTADAPHKPLTQAKKRGSGRNNRGRITVRHRGGGHRRHYRIIDYKRDKRNLPGVIETIEYDPNRTCNIALVKYPDGERRYILASTGMAEGMRIVSGAGSEPAEGNCLPLLEIPLGTMVHNVEMKRGKGGQLVRSAGGHAEVMAREGTMVQVKLPSGEIRNFCGDCCATIGQLGNAEHVNIVLGSAGRSRWLGRRPHVRGVAMNPVDHPMGGGEGKASGGHPVSPWGQKAKGLRTRKRGKRSDKYIVKRRKSK